MAKYSMGYDTDTGEYHFKKDGEHVSHDHASMGTYSCGGYDGNGNYQPNMKKNGYISHNHTDEKGVMCSTDYAFSLGDPMMPNTMLSPNYGIPQSVGKIIENAKAGKMLEKTLSDSLKNK